ncbi:MAG: efflux RND transporter periplasmic adaptor subunit [Proteobacteria bacterium]|nr:efflux RND transporter periplasmic adaptor subunit [Pseudomonadota bacterium]
MSPWLSKKTVVTTLLIVGCFWVYRHFGKAPQMAGYGEAMQVSVAKVLARDIQQWNEYAGRLVAIDKVEIRPRIHGTIEAIHYQSGEIVKKGELLFTLDSRTYAAEFARAQGTFASAQAQEVLSSSQYERAIRLMKDKVISQSELDTRSHDMLVSKALSKSAKAALETAKINLEYTQIRAPITGKISRPEITVGNLAEAGHILATVVSNSPIYADFEMDEQAFLEYTKTNALVKISKPIPVMMGLANETGTPHSGYIESFDNHLDSASGTIRVRAVFQNEKNHLVPGSFARIKLGGHAQQKALLITDRAVGTDQNKKFVLVVDKENKVNYREIKLGNVVQGLRIVLAGLKADEQIVVNGLQRVRPGSDVKPELVPMEQET